MRVDNNLFLVAKNDIGFHHGTTVLYPDIFIGLKKMSGYVQSTSKHCSIEPFRTYRRDDRRTTFTQIVNMFPLKNELISTR